MNQCIAQFEDADGMASQLLFAPRPVTKRTGRFVFRGGEIFGYLAVERTHGGRRVRSWLFIAQVPDSPSPADALCVFPHVQGVAHTLVCAMQPRRHREGGAVGALIVAIEQLETDGVLHLVPPTYWLAAGVSAKAGLGVRRPTLSEMQRWRFAS